MATTLNGSIWTIDFEAETINQFIAHHALNRICINLGRLMYRDFRFCGVFGLRKFYLSH